MAESGLHRTTRSGSNPDVTETGQRIAHTTPEPLQTPPSPETQPPETAIIPTKETLQTSSRDLVSHPVISVIVPMKSRRVMVPMPYHRLIRIVQVIAVGVSPSGQADLFTDEVDVGIIRNVTTESSDREEVSCGEIRMTTGTISDRHRFGTESKVDLRCIRDESEPSRRLRLLAELGAVGFHPEPWGVVGDHGSIAIDRCEHVDAS
jgi:hypothetical protein